MDFSVDGKRRASAMCTAAVALAIAGGCRDPDARRDESGPFDAAVPAFDAAAPPADAAPADAAPAYIPCPAPAAAREDPDALLDRAAALREDGEDGAAASCAELAAELVPVAVEAYQLRASALAALERHAEAREAFAMALALDPDDPDTLAAAADYYINGAGRRGRDAALLGLTYARRGAENVADRWRQGDPVHGQLIVLEAQALNDLGRPDEALRAADRALELESPPADARYERGVSLFLLSRHDDAEEAFEAYLNGDGDGDGDAARAAYAHHHLGLIHERRGDDARAREFFSRAADLSDGGIREPVAVSAEAFRAEVDEAISSLPPDERTSLDSVKVEVADLPAAEDLVASQPPLPPTILGLYRGLPHGEQAPRAGDDADGGALAERTIVLYRKNLARVAADRADLSRQIRDTLRHEIGHVQGLGEEELRRRGLE